MKPQLLFFNSVYMNKQQFSDAIWIFLIIDSLLEKLRQRKFILFYDKTRYLVVFF